MTSRIVGGWVLVLGLGGCTDAGGLPQPDAVPAREPAVVRTDGLRVEPGLRVGQSLTSPAHELRRQTGAFKARGSRHELELLGKRTRITKLPSSLELRKAGELRRRATGGAHSHSTAALELETRSITRGGRALLAPASSWSAGAAGKVERPFEHGAEQWSNRDEGAEVVYRFTEPPSGGGNLVISVELGSADRASVPISVSSDARGLHLQMADGSRFFYQHATWIDASGARTHVPAVWKGASGAHSIELEVPAELVDASQYPVVLDPLVGPDLGTGTRPLTQVSAGIEPEVATDGESFLAVFEDAQRIRAVRVDGAGHLLSDTWLDLGEDGKQQFDATVTYGAGHYLVAWWEDDGTDVRIRARALNQDGSLIGTSNVTVSSEVGFDAALAFNGSAFLASWIGYGDTPGIRVALLDTNGQVVPDSERLVTTSATGSHPSIAVGSGAALVAWEDTEGTADYTHRLRAARVELDGDVLDPGGFRLSESESDENQAHVAAGGDRFLVVWHGAGEAGLPGSIRGALVDEAGDIAAPAFPISRSTGEASVPSVAFDGSQFAVAWKDDREQTAMRGAQVSTTGVVSGTEDRVLASVPASAPGYFDSTGLAWNGEQFLLVFQGNRPGGFSGIVGIEGSLLEPDLSLASGPLGLSQMPAGQLAPQVVWNGRNYVVSWIDERTGSFDLATPRAVRISSQGTILDPDTLALSGDVPSSGQIASNEDGPTLVTLAQPNGTAEFRFLGAGGRLREPSPLDEGVTGPVMAAGNGNNFLTVATRMRPDYTFEISGRVLRASGTLGASFVIDPEASGSGDVAAAGNGYLVASWSNGGTLFPVSATGLVGPPIALSLASTTLHSATNGSSTLVSWVPGFGDEPFAAQARFFANGAFRGRTLELAPTTSGSTAALAWDGRKYWAVWSVGDSPRPFIRSIGEGGRLGPVSQLLDDECRGPVLASNGRRQLLLACYEYTNQYRIVSVRTHLIDTVGAN